MLGDEVGANGIFVCRMIPRGFKFKRYDSVPMFVEACVKWCERGEVFKKLEYSHVLYHSRNLICLPMGRSCLL
jgi:hypothetical protein